MTVDASAAALIEEIDRILPPIPKPADTELVEHPSGCLQCSYVRDDLRKYDGQRLPHLPLRGLHMEMTCLSAAGWRWALPSFLSYSLSGPHHDDIETEFMIYFLGGVESSQPEARARLALFD